jgi:hypothetical protein
VINGKRMIPGGNDGVAQPGINPLPSMSSGTANDCTQKQTDRRGLPCNGSDALVNVSP